MFSDEAGSGFFSAAGAAAFGCHFLRSGAEVGIGPGTVGAGVVGVGVMVAAVGCGSGFVGGDGARRGFCFGWCGWFGVDGWGGEAFGSADAFEEEFGYVFDGDVFASGFAWGASEHALAEGAAYGQDFFSCFSCGGGQGLLGFAEAVVGDALVAGLLFFPELRTAGSAAEGVFAVAGEFGCVVREDVEEVAGGVVDTVVAAEVAGVVVGDGRFAWGGCEFFVGDEGFEVLGVVHDLVVAADLFVLVAEGVHAVGAAGDDEFGADGVEGRDVFVG